MGVDDPIRFHRRTVEIEGGRKLYLYGFGMAAQLEQSEQPERPEQSELAAKQVPEPLNPKGNLTDRT